MVLGLHLLVISETAFNDCFEDKGLKEGGCHETIYKSGIIEVPDTAKIESRRRRSVLDVKEC